MAYKKPLTDEELEKLLYDDDYRNILLFDDDFNTSIKQITNAKLETRQLLAIITTP